MKLYEESWPKFEQVTKKEPTPRRLEALIFDEKSTSDFFAFFILVRIKRFCIYTHKDSKKIKLIHGEKRNFKNTDGVDFELFKSINKFSLKVGIGFDVHRLVKNKKLLLGGIKIPSTLGTLGHSDGDPVLHAIIDAILGACQMGDIGEKFSDKNKKFKNIKSTYLIEKIIEQIENKNYEINNLDINIITQFPKLKKFKNKIVKNISKLCKIPLEKINVKAKTTEKLGVIGQEKAIAAEVIVSVIKYD